MKSHTSDIGKMSEGFRVVVGDTKDKNIRNIHVTVKHRQITEMCKGWY